MELLNNLLYTKVLISKKEIYLFFTTEKICLQIGENYNYITRPLFVLLNDNENTRNNFVNVIISRKIKDTILKLFGFFLDFYYSNLILYIIIQN